MAFETLQRHYPNCPDIWNGLGLIAEEKTDLSAALDLYQHALQHAPDEPEYHNNLALLRQKRQEPRLALWHFQKVWELQPGPHSRWNLIQALLSTPSLSHNLDLCQQLLWQDPTDFKLHQLLLEQARSQQADLLNWYQQLFRKHPHSGITSYFLACWHELQGQTEKSFSYLNLAEQLQPDWELPAQQKVIWQLKSNHFQALELARQRDTQQPTPATALMRLTLLPPPIAASTETHNAVLQEMERLCERLFATERPSLLPFQFYTPSFYLAYQNVDDRLWQTRLSKLYQQFIPTRQDPGGTERSGEKIRVGILSRFLYSHAVSFCFGSLLSTLSEASELELHVFLVTDTRAPAQVSFPLSADTRLIALQSTTPLLENAEIIRSSNCQFLIYLEIGMDPLTYMLAYSRLAPVQIMLAGHPVTSGIPTIDYFVTTAELEIPTCQKHYSENWVGLPGLIDYQRPAKAVALTRAQVGLPDHKHLYFCPMTLHKIHPDLDQALGEILRADPQAIIVLFQYRQTNYHQRLQARFVRSMPDVVERILFLPFQSFEGFLSLLAHADVVLDSFYFGGGNTSFLAFSLGKPVVTWPSPFLKARFTLGMYRAMNLDLGIANSRDDYVEKALQLGQNPDWNQSASQAIQARWDAIFEQKQWNQAFLAWILSKHG